MSNELGNGLAEEVNNVSLHSHDGESIEESVRWITWYLRRLIQAGEIYNKELHKKFQVSQPQVSCIVALAEYGVMPISRLARYILVKPSTVTGIVDRLEQKGLVTRIRSQADRRVVTIELTDSGRALASSAPPPIPREMIEGLKKLSHDQVAMIVESLRILVSQLHEDRI